jgi:hypothetical protein
MGMKFFLSPLPGLEYSRIAFPQLALWAIIARHSVAKYTNG